MNCFQVANIGFSDKRWSIRFRTEHTGQSCEVCACRVTTEVSSCRVPAYILSCGSSEHQRICRLSRAPGSSNGATNPPATRTTPPSTRQRKARVSPAGLVAVVVDSARHPSPPFTLSLSVSLSLSFYVVHPSTVRRPTSRSPPHPQPANSYTRRRLTSASPAVREWLRFSSLLAIYTLLLVANIHATTTQIYDDEPSSTKSISISHLRSDSLLKSRTQWMSDHP